MTRTLNAVVAGGGIGGLALGIALRRIGAQVIVAEQAARIQDVGAGLVLYPNGVKALEAISARLGAAVRAAGHVSEPGETRPVLSPRGEVLADDPVGLLGARFGAPQVSLLRSALQETLLDEAVAAGVTLRTGVRVVDHADHGDHVEVALAGGTTLRADLLVGADGVHSRVRQQLLADGPAVYRGFSTLRGRGAAPAAYPAGFVIKGAEADLFAAPVGGGQLYWSAKINAEPGVWPVKEPAAAIRDLLDLISGWDGRVRDLIGGTDPDGLVMTDINDRDPGAEWTRGRVALLGDAAHPMTPALGQGAGMAVEDAVVLARCLHETGAVPPALAAYTARRAPHTAVAVRLSRRKSPAGDGTGFSTRDRRLTELFAWNPPRLPDPAPASLSRT